MVPYFFQIFAARIAPVIKPVDMIMIEMIFTIGVGKVIYNKPATRAAANIVPKAIWHQPEISRTSFISFTKYFKEIIN